MRSAGWTPVNKWKLTLVEVWPKSVRLSRVVEAGQPMRTLTLPNPVSSAAAAMLPRKPQGCLSYREDLARKPELTFVQLSDPQIDDGTIDPRGAFTDQGEAGPVVVKEINRLRPALVFVTGDLVNKNTPVEWKMYKDIFLSKLTAPTYSMAGNHDALFTFDGFVDGYDRANKKKENQATMRIVQDATRKLNRKGLDGPLALFKKYTGHRRTYYTVEKNGCVFICMAILTQAIDNEQLEWLKKELERTSNAKHVFVLGHYPLLNRFRRNVRKGKGQEKMLALLKEYKVAAYICGHRHGWNQYLRDGTMHMVGGRAGGRRGSSYSIYHVFPDRIVAGWRPFHVKALLSKIILIYA